MKIKFCGATREVTGSCHLLTLDDGFTILLDCGLYQGSDEAWENFNNEWLFDPKQIDCLVLSHAHIDHTGRLPKLFKDGFRGDIYSTHATRSLCAAMLADSAKIQTVDAERASKHKYDKNEPLYDIQDVNGVMRLFNTFSYDHWVDIRPGIKVLFRDAGHILGSSNVTFEIMDGGKKTVFGFTGDIGRPARPILRDPQPMPECDYLICESTYGDRDHEAAPEELDHFLEIIQETCVQNKGKLLIPAFSVGRTQEIVYLLDQLESAGKLPRIPVFVDSPLAVDATQIFRTHPECFDSETQRYMEKEGEPFGFDKLQYTRTAAASKNINEYKGPCIIISASGMLNAGRIRHHLVHNIENSRNALLIVGYCAPNTPGGILRGGARHLSMMGQHLAVNLKVHIMDSFSAHADRGEMSDFLKNQHNVKRLWLVHGDYDAQQAFRERLLGEGFKDVEIPTLGQEYSFS